MATERFETILEKLEKTVHELESGDLPLEQALESFKSGVELVKRGMTRLNDMERKVELLLKEVEGESTVPFDAGADEEEDGEDA
ncbi:MAG: exodeoxyribonuclease VII small subunit [Myxococcales bacterium]|nr:MAG: exodeoxyribonuclease VII small subunit [Myxococcales bacterium]